MFHSMFHSGRSYSHHGSGVFPLGELVEDPQQVNTGEQVPPAELVVIARFLHKTNHQLYGAQRSVKISISLK